MHRGFNHIPSSPVQPLLFRSSTFSILTDIYRQCKNHATIDAEFMTLPYSVNYPSIRNFLVKGNLNAKASNTQSENMVYDLTVNMTLCWVPCFNQFKFHAGLVVGLSWSCP